MAKTLMENKLPTVDDIIKLKENSKDLNKDVLWNEEQELRNKLNDMLNNGEIDLYPRFDEKDDLVLTMINSNNIREFKY
jgi:isocitrate dehydrogenase